eukprot:366405-Chlamydomonas_euryale.AAC.4
MSPSDRAQGRGAVQDDVSVAAIFIVFPADVTRDVHASTKFYFTDFGCVAPGQLPSRKAGRVTQYSAHVNPLTLHRPDGRIADIHTVSTARAKLAESDLCPLCIDNAPTVTFGAFCVDAVDLTRIVDVFFARRVVIKPVIVAIGIATTDGPYV